MPHYFFDVLDGGFTKDNEGRACEDLSTARIEAIAALPIIARVAITPEGGRSVVVTIRDENGTNVYRAALTLIETWC